MPSQSYCLCQTAQKQEAVQSVSEPPVRRRALTEIPVPVLCLVTLVAGFFGTSPAFAADVKMGGY